MNVVTFFLEICGLIARVLRNVRALMELNAAKKTSNEVVLVIPEEEAAPVSSKMASLEEHSKDPVALSPEIVKVSSSPWKPLKPPVFEGLSRRRPIPSSAFSKPKSRFVEQTVPQSPSSSEESQMDSQGLPFHGSSNHKAGGMPKPPPAVEEEDEEEEICKKGQLVDGNKERRRLKVRILIEWSILVSSMGCLITSFFVHRLQNFVLWGLEIWKWCLMVTVICCGRLVTQWFIAVLVFLIQRNFLLGKKMLYYIYGLKNSVQVCMWLGLILLSWYLVFHQGVARSQKTKKVLDSVSRALISMLIASLIWLVKTLSVKILASSFHMTRFFDRVHESIFHQYLLQMLSGPSTKSTGQLSLRNMGKGKRKAGEEQAVIDVAKLQKMSQEKVSAWTMKGLISVIRNSGLTTISNTIGETFNETEQRDREITNEWEAKSAAYQIFKNVAKPGYKYIEEEDLLKFLSKEEFEIVLPLFEGAAETGKIKKSALKNWVVKCYFDRKSLAHSLNDTKAAVLLVVFMFGNTCKMAFEAIIFVFVMHPFDVGDRCVVDGVQMVVEKMNILTTVFLRFDNEKIYYPNVVLATKPISNFYRSPDMNDLIVFAVDVSTSVECIGLLKARVKAYIDNQPNHWHPNHIILVQDIVLVNKMNMGLYVQHTMNFQNFGEKHNRRSDLVLEVKKIFEDLSIRYNLLPQEVHLSYKGATPPLMPVVQNFLQTFYGNLTDSKSSLGIIDHESLAIEGLALVGVRCLALQQDVHARLKRCAHFASLVCLAALSWRYLWLAASAGDLVFFLGSDAAYLSAWCAFLLVALLMASWACSLVMRLVLEGLVITMCASLGACRCEGLGGEICKAAWRVFGASCEAVMEMKNLE
ncbi:hypothetical protein J5N97_009439 [Dioscorea zingiberensis]|uniref:Mechanosensitive ion channel MscS domain-containing protein n=1 Tax=Dioscorea zingiberensis TaxID=325984 RepID=A0A9D5HLN3_9LILI|nr:hypothetical protein J5N97_009439 [Dioscorea zingiberensis]